MNDVIKKEFIGKNDTKVNESKIVSTVTQKIYKPMQKEEKIVKSQKKEPISKNDDEWESF